MLHLRLIIFSMGGDAHVDIDVLLTIDFVNLKIKPTQSFGYSYRDVLCVYIHRGKCMSIYIYTVFLKNKFYIFLWILGLKKDTQGWTLSCKCHGTSPPLATHRQPYSQSTPTESYVRERKDRTGVCRRAGRQRCSSSTWGPMSYLHWGLKNRLNLLKFSWSDLAGQTSFHMGPNFDRCSPPSLTPTPLRGGAKNRIQGSHKLLHVWWVTSKTYIWSGSK
jgi:hypothetical protein